MPTDKGIRVTMKWKAVPFIREMRSRGISMLDIRVLYGRSGLLVAPTRYRIKTLQIIHLATRISIRLRCLRTGNVEIIKSRYGYITSIEFIYGRFKVSSRTWIL